MKNIYFDNSATSRYKHLKSYISYIKLSLKSANSGRSSHKDSIRQAMAIEECRETIRANIKDGEVVFTKNCTEALNIAIFGSGLNGEVLTTVYEHNSVLRPLYRLETQNRIKIKYLYPDTNLRYTQSMFERAITKNVKFVVITECSNVIGEVLPIEKIAEITKAKGVTLIVDTAQSLGHIKTDYKNVDIIASSGHKGLRGFQGSGILIYDKAKTPKPWLYGGTGTFSSSLIQPEGIEGLESGTQSGAIISALNEGIKSVYKNLERDKIKIAKMSEYLYQNLNEIKTLKLYTPKSAKTNGIIAFNIGNKDCGEVAAYLDKEGFSVRSGMMCAPKIMEHLNAKNGVVRISVGINNNMRQCRKIVEVIATLPTKQKTVPNETFL